MQDSAQHMEVGAGLSELLGIEAVSRSEIYRIFISNGSGKLFAFLPAAKPLVLERPELLLWWWWGDRIELCIL